MSEFLRRFAEDFAELTADNLQSLDRLYSSDVRFRDPLHQINGLDALRSYFAELYANTRDISFRFHSVHQVDEGTGYLRWTMRFSHPRLRGGRPINVEGCSHLRWHERVYLHHDYFDAGALLYEHLPLMGALISWLKRRMV